MSLPYGSKTPSCPVIMTGQVAKNRERSAGAEKRVGQKTNIEVGNTQGTYVEDNVTTWSPVVYP
jgi:hypothetical protein